MSDVINQIKELRAVWAAEAKKTGESSLLHSGAVKAANEILRLLTAPAEPTTIDVPNESAEPKRKKKTKAVVVDADATLPGRGATV